MTIVSRPFKTVYSGHKFEVLALSRDYLNPYKKNLFEATVIVKVTIGIGTDGLRADPELLVSKFFQHDDIVNALEAERGDDYDLDYDDPAIALIGCNQFIFSTKIKGIDRIEPEVLYPAAVEWLNITRGY